MDFDFSPEQVAFADEVERFLDDNDDPEVFDLTRDAEPMRTNPEVMGRTEPVEMDRSGFQGRPEQQAHAEQMDFWPEMHQFRERLNEIQSQFIDEPREAVKKAERLIEEAVDHMAKSMHEHVKRMHSDVEGNADTEKLRLVMRSYRAFIEKLDNRRAA